MLRTLAYNVSFIFCCHTQIFDLFQINRRICNQLHLCYDLVTHCGGNEWTHAYFFLSCFSCYCQLIWILLSIVAVRDTEKTALQVTSDSKSTAGIMEPRPATDYTSRLQAEQKREFSVLICIWLHATRIASTWILVWLRNPTETRQCCNSVETSFINTLRHTYCFWVLYK
jgi:hypothetical protein